jgi:NADPH-dependent glutamate synthase beta subunit-like oxidoreductase
MTEADARIAINLTLQPEPAESLAQRIGKTVEEVAPVLEKLANNGILFKMIFQEALLYSIYPFAPGTLEFLAKKGIMDEEMAKLIAQWMDDLAVHALPNLPKGYMRVIPVQTAIEAETTRLSYEEVEKYLDEATYIAGVDCICKTTMANMGQGCDHPREGMCLWFGPIAEYYVQGGVARHYTNEEAKAIVKKGEEAGLVHQALLPQEGAPCICNCCSCCCQVLRANSQLRSNYISQVTAEKCVACGACVEHCQFHALKLGDALCKAKGLPADDSGKEMGADKEAPSDRLSSIVDKNGTSPCKVECPAHISVQGYIRLVSEGKYTEALKLIKKDNPLPAVCGRVCPHPCESACTRCDVDEAVAIDPIKRFIADQDLKAETRYIPEIKERREEKVAVIGSGPAGLSCAYYLAVDGYQVTIFEKLPMPGGMLTMGIPSFRLGRDVIKAEIDVIREMGVEFKTGVEIGKDITIAQLRKQGYKAFFMAVGAQVCKGLGLKGEDLDGVIPGLDFLRDVNLGKKISLGNRVAVIGGGNVAIDVARTAIRMGASEVELFCLESRDEMPVWQEELEEALEEGVKINPSWGPKKLIGTNGKVTGVEFKECTSVFDANGRFKPTFNTKVTRTEAVTAVLVAIGQETDWACLTPECACRLTDLGTMQVDPMTWQTTDPDIFAGGDAATGPKIVIEAIAAGKQAAISIRRYLQGNHLKLGREREFRAMQKVEGSGYDRIPRQKISKAAPESRAKDFSEVHPGFTEEQVRKETERCLGCGVVVLNEEECKGCGVCTVQCEFGAIKLIAREEKIHPPKDVMEFLQEIQDYAKEKAKGEASV